MDGNVGPLNGIRVIDVTTDRGELAGRMLADMGAEVIKVEPPGGSPSRSIAPFERGRENDPDGSLYWAAVSLGKRSVVIDHDSPEGIEQLRTLLRGADVFIESFAPGTLAGYGLAYDDVRALNPALIYVSITPFGQTGPAAHLPAEDITLQAAGGLVSLQGDYDRPPLPVGEPHQAAFHAGGQAAADVVIALSERLHSGLGQHLDVSTQTAMEWTLMNASGFPTCQGQDPPGHGDDRGNGPVTTLAIWGIHLDMPTIWDCADGHLTTGYSVGEHGGRAIAGTLAWIDAEGELPAEDQDLLSVSWPTWTLDIVEGRLETAVAQRGIDRIAAFFQGRSKAELMARSVDEGLLLAPVFTATDLAKDDHLLARGYWNEIEGRAYPGAFALMSRTPVGPRGAPPALGEGQALLDQPRTPTAPKANGGERRRPFEDVKIADFAWIGVGPIIAKAIADHGATTVHLESETRPDGLRNGPPFAGGEPGINRSQFFANFNTSKYSLACNLATDGGRKLARQAAEWADVVVESFTPGTLGRMGLDYATLSQDRPELIMLSTCLRGQTGPQAKLAGYGNQGATLAGIHGITGWPDRPPSGPWGAYTDFITPRYGVAALAAAIFDRKRTGMGQYIDLSQVEASIHFMEPEILDATVNGHDSGAQGTWSPVASPNAVYATKGTQRYLALAVRTAEHWAALRSVAPLDAFADASLAELDARRAQDAGINAALTAWLADLDPFDAAKRLQGAGVPAYVVLRPSDLYNDEQLAHRQFFQELKHTEMGPTLYDGLVTRFSDMPAGLRMPGPCLGEHTDYVLRDLFGLSDEEIIEYAAAGVLA